MNRPSLNLPRDQDHDACTWGRHMITRLTMAAAAALALALSGLTSCNREPVERSASQTEDDHKISEKVKAAFASSPSFKFPDVVVTTFKGRVQLSGFVVSEDQKKAAEDLARQVSGVEAVENNISLKR